MHTRTQTLPLWVYSKTEPINSQNWLSNHRCLAINGIKEWTKEPNSLYVNTLEWGIPCLRKYMGSSLHIMIHVNYLSMELNGRPYCRPSVRPPLLNTSTFRCMLHAHKRAKERSKIACYMHVGGPMRKVKWRNDVTSCMYISICEGRKDWVVTHAYYFKIKRA